MSSSVFDRRTPLHVLPTLRQCDVDNRRAFVGLQDFERGFLGGPYTQRRKFHFEFGDADAEFFVRDSPAQIDLGEANLARKACRTHLGEILLDQVVALGFHVAEGAAEEDLYFPGLGTRRGDDRHVVLLNTFLSFSR